FGQHWTKITRGVPSSPLSFARNVTEDPARQGLLYLGTENRLYFSTDDGGHWQSLMTDLPPAPMYWLTVQPHFHDLVVGTYGRGIWILDDVTPLEQLTPEVAAKPAHLFAPREAWRFHAAVAPNAMFDDPSAGENPPYGASINYWLKSVPDGVDSVRVLVTDASGDTVRSLSGPAEAGINRVWWDLQTEPTDVIKRRVTPENATWMDVGKKGWFAMPWGRQFSILSPPGAYTVTMEVGGERFSQPLTVKKDPHSEGSLDDIDAQVRMLRSLYADMNRVAAMTNRIEWMRRQLADLRPVLEGADAADLLASGDSLEASLRHVEAKLVQLKLTGTGQDDVRWPVRLAGRVSYLAGEVASNDFPPTDQARAVQEILEQSIDQVSRELDAAVTQSLQPFNQELARRGLGGIVGELPQG
ncbi:MAG: sialidase, partial [Gemmatimonadota bacterium]